MILKTKKLININIFEIKSFITFLLKKNNYINKYYFYIKYCII